MVSAFDLKHIVKTDLEEPFYNEVRQKGNVINTLTAVSINTVCSHGKRTETTTSKSSKYPRQVTK